MFGTLENMLISMGIFSEHPDIFHSTILSEQASFHIHQNLTETFADINVFRNFPHNPQVKIHSL